MSNEELKSMNVINLIERKPEYTEPLLYALAAVDNIIDEGMNAPITGNNGISEDEMINVASQIAGISKDEALTFCRIMIKLTEKNA